MGTRIGRCLALVGALVALLGIWSAGSVSAQQTLSSVTNVEGNSGTTQVRVNIPGPFDAGDSVNYWTSDGTATAGSDYEAVSATAVCPGSVTPAGASPRLS